MKIFNWVHRKFSQNNIRGVKDSNEGHRVSEGETACALSLPRRMTSKDVAVEVEVELELEPHALLAIGTFGLNHHHHHNHNHNHHHHQIQDEDQEMDEEKKEKSAEIRKLVERAETEVTPVEVELFHDQLEKAFGLKQHNNEDAPNPNCDPVFVGNAEAHSTPIANNGNGNGVSVYPLREFFHSPLVEVHRAKLSKHKRTSLEDLFSTTSARPSVDHASQNSHKNPKDTAAPLHKPSTLDSFVKKVLRRKTNTGQGLDSGSVGKLDKVIGLFQKKIYPEVPDGCELGCVSGARGKVRSRCKGVGKDKIKSFTRLTSCILPPQNDDDHYGATTVSECDHELFCLQTTPSGSGLCSQEHWIKTDAEYVVLEL